jgi:chromosome segregation protein
MESMRLTHLKLAGFKSFVDPTTIHLSGNRVGIVGPNGCGKSNVMEAIRWVLGESSARELRGDSMQDVIFNGSLNRKPVSRASVELHFDNSLGGAAGSWGQYAEIAVKRVLERDGTSSYIINNQQVRRRDITDLFLGTGVGSRAYAIIGQNTISRIIEAKPEELRVYLEEAAGVSRYKDRRRETELRLRDTRENLLRVDDIRREIGNQISLLQAQSETALRYRQLKQQYDLAQQLLWLLKKQQAATGWENAKQRVLTLVNQLEAEMAALRKFELDIEQARQTQLETSTQMQSAQTAFYESSAALGNIEQQLKHAEESASRAQSLLAELNTQLASVETQITTQKTSLSEQNAMLKQAETQTEASQTGLQQARNALPEFESKQKTAQQALSNAQSALAKIEQSLQLSLANMRHQRSQLEQTQVRQQRLQTSIQAIVIPDETQLTAALDKQQHAQQAFDTLQAEVNTLQIQETTQQQTFQAAQQALHETARNIAALEAQQTTLLKIQQSVGNDADQKSWLGKHQLQDRPHFWQGVRVSPGWETAVEALLGERLNALLVESLALAGKMDVPPMPLVLCASGAGSTATAADRKDMQALAEQVEILKPELADVMHDWLSGIYTADTLDIALSQREQLAAGEAYICPQGHIVSRNSVKLHASNATPFQGLLERQRELEGLQKQLPALQQALQKDQTTLEALNKSLGDTRSALQAKRVLLQQQSQQLRQLALDTEKLAQQRQYAQTQLQQTQEELDRVSAQAIEVNNKINELEAEKLRLETELAALRLQQDQARTALSSADTELGAVREALRKAEFEAQEKGYLLKTISNKIIELNNSIKVFTDQKSHLQKQLTEAQSSQQEQGLEGLKELLEKAVNDRRQKEEALAAARNLLAERDTQLVELERQRMQCDHGLHPLRDKLEQARLAEQEARLYFEQCMQWLQGVDEEALQLQLPKPSSPKALESQSAELQEQMDALGAVNMAAVEQLASENERAAYLDSQALDLNTAIATLEDAIHRIDKETRGKLQHTFDEVNTHFGELFGKLFGGGQARLELLGDEILDTGVQVFAQPPGKKNSTIHLLSGGEKALTAIALIFAIFRLNPAPFCLMDEVDAPLDDSNTERFCNTVRQMTDRTQFVFITHNKIAMEMAQQLVGVTMQESGVSRVVEVDVDEAMRLVEEVA